MLPCPPFWVTAGSRSFSFGSPLPCHSSDCPFPSGAVEAGGGGCRAAGQKERFGEGPDSGAGDQMFPTGWLFSSLPASARFPTGHSLRARAQPAGAVPPLLLAASEHGRTHHTLAFIALALWFQPDASPGYCWPFQGSRSEVLIRLPAQIQPTALTIQHTSKRASPPETTSSAPQDFTVSVSLGWGLGAGTRDPGPGRGETP